MPGGFISLLWAYRAPEVGTLSTLALFPILGENVQSSSITYSCESFADTLSSVKEVPFYFWFPAGLYHPWMLHFVKCRGCIGGDDPVAFLYSQCGE